MQNKNTPRHDPLTMKAQDQLEALLLEGLKGDETALTRNDWAAIRQEAMAKVKGVKGGKGRPG